MTTILKALPKYLLVAIAAAALAIAAPKCEGGGSHPFSAVHLTSAKPNTSTARCQAYGNVCDGYVFYLPHTTWICELTQYPYNSADYHVAPGYTCKRWKP